MQVTIIGLYLAKNVFQVHGNLAVILPISGMMSLFIIPGIHCAARAHGVF